MDLAELERQCIIMNRMNLDIREMCDRCIAEAVNGKNYLFNRTKRVICNLRRLIGPNQEPHLLQPATA